MGFLEKKNRSKIEQLAKLCLFVLLSYFVFSVTFCHILFVFVFVSHFVHCENLVHRGTGLPPLGSKS